MQSLKRFLILTWLSVGISTHYLCAGQTSVVADTADDPTPVQVGTMSERERAQAKLYSESGIRGDDLDSRTRNGEDVRIAETPPMPFLSPHPTPLDKVISNLVCSADAVVVGTVKNRHSQLTNGRNWVFSELSVQADQILKSNPVAPLASGERLAVTRSGGTILLNSKIVDAVPAGGHLLKNGQYLFFLKYYADTGSYAVNGSNSVFRVRGEALLALPDLPNKTLEKTTITQVSTIANSAACAGNSTGGTR